MEAPHRYVTDAADNVNTGWDGTAIARKIDNEVRQYTQQLTKPNLFTEFGAGQYMPNDLPDAWRVAVWTAFFLESGITFWDDDTRLQFGEPWPWGSRNANAYISDLSRDYFLFRQRFAARLSLTMTRASPTTNDPTNLRAYGLENAALRLYAAYIHNYQNHSVTNSGKTLAIALPAGSYIVEWYDPKTGNPVGTPGTVSGGAQTLAVPDFVQDIALTIRPDSPVGIVTSGLPDAAYGSPYYLLLQARGGLGPYTWTIVDGALPPGMVLESESGLLSGAPVSGGTYTFTVQVTGADSTTDQIELTINATAPPPAPAFTGLGLVALIVSLCASLRRQCFIHRCQRLHRL
jgi:hypothetical protein